MNELFIHKRFTADSSAIIGAINGFLDEYTAQGYTLTLRQVYYQLIARDLLPASWADPATGTKNSVKNYKRVGSLLSDARLAGLVDWNAIEDRGRVLRLPAHWGKPSDIVRSAAVGYAVDKWADQPNHIEVMVEKDALAGILGPACARLDVGFIANRGYSSSSAMYECGKRLVEKHHAGKAVHVLYLGDHDPSGIDMTRDVYDRLAIFTRGAFDVHVHRLALNMDQVRTYSPPENPAKTTDSRSRDYIAMFGTSSWELDALEPRVLAGLVDASVMALRDEARWREATRREKNGQRSLMRIVKHYERVREFTKGLEAADAKPGG
jgi:hypothetical protein